MLLFSTDIDGTIYDGPETARAFASYWENLCSITDRRPLLAYNTGRSLDDALDLIERTELPNPDWFICGVGTTIFDPLQKETLASWHELLSQGWDIAIAKQMVTTMTSARPQPPECQSDYKSSWFWEGATTPEIRALDESLANTGVSAQVVYSSNRDLDLVPRGANKGNAVRFLADRLGIPLSEIIVAGDSGNDASMFLVDNVRGVVVSNAESSLKTAVPNEMAYHATEPCAHGVIEGIERYRER